MFLEKCIAMESYTGATSFFLEEKKARNTDKNEGTHLHFLLDSDDKSVILSPPLSDSTCFVARSFFPPHSLFRPKSVRLHRYTFLCVYLFRWMGTRGKTANEKDVRSSIYCQTNTQKQNSKMFFLFLKLILETKSPRHVPPTTVVLTAHARKFQK